MKIDKKALITTVLGFIITTLIGYFYNQYLKEKDLHWRGEQWTEQHVDDLWFAEYGEYPNPPQWWTPPQEKTPEKLPTTRVGK